VIGGELPFLAKGEFTYLLYEWLFKEEMGALVLRPGKDAAKRRSSMIVTFYPLI
jgi:hypothetical protein